MNSAVEPINKVETSVEPQNPVIAEFEQPKETENNFESQEGNNVSQNGVPTPTVEQNPVTSEFAAEAAIGQFGLSPQPQANNDSKKNLDNNNNGLDIFG